MTNDPNAPLRQAALDLIAAAWAYDTRWFANGPGHPDNERLYQLAHAAEVAGDAVNQFLHILEES